MRIENSFSNTCKVIKQKLWEKSMHGNDSVIYLFNVIK